MSTFVLDHIPQERTPVHLRASKSSMHPALMEKGRAIPQPHIGPRHHGSPTPHSFKVNILDNELFVDKLENRNISLVLNLTLLNNNLANFCSY